MNNQDFLWVEKYRPKTIEDCILPEDTKKTFKSFLEKGEIPNLLLAGPPGIGKTTIAKALCHELGVDYYVINGSDEGRFLDTVRNQAKNFAATVSLSASDAKHKVIIIDESRQHNPRHASFLLRANIGAFYKNCRFIFTCNYRNRIVEPIQSRCSVIEFGITGKNKPAIASKFFKRLQTILDKENIKADPKVLAELINKHFPDWRRVLNECQRHASSGEIDSSILANFSDVNIQDLIQGLRIRSFPRSVNGSLIIWTMILVYFFVVFTMLFLKPLTVLALLLLCSLLLNISIRSRS